jgi:hypothetical protein
MSAERKAGSSRGSRATDQPVIFGELGGEPATQPTDVDAQVGSIDIFDAHFLNEGGGIYKSESGEIGGYAQQTFGVVSIGAGSALNRDDVFIGFSVESKTNVVGPGSVAQLSMAIGWDSSGLYVSHTQAVGTSFETGVAGVAKLSGTQTVTHLHPIDALTSAFNSVIGPLADPSNPLADPTGFSDWARDSGPDLGQRP